MMSMKCTVTAYSHARNPGPAKKGESNFETHKKSLGEVDDKYEELKKIHGTKYTPEQLRMWAHDSSREA